MLETWLPFEHNWHPLRWTLIDLHPAFVSVDGMMELLPTDPESMAGAKMILDPARNDDAMDGVEAITAAPSTAIGKTKRKKIGRK